MAITKPEIQNVITCQILSRVHSNVCIFYVTPWGQHTLEGITTQTSNKQHIKLCTALAKPYIYMGLSHVCVYKPFIGKERITYSISFTVNGMCYRNHTHPHLHRMWNLKMCNRFCLRFSRETIPKFLLFHILQVLYWTRLLDGHFVY